MSGIRVHLLLVGALLATLLGCGNEFGPMGSIAGKLTLDGKPPAADTKVIFMQSTQGYTGFGMTDAEGNYRIEWRRSGTTYDGLPVGQYDVMLVPANAIDIDAVSAEDMLAGGPKKVTGKVDIPAKFLRTTTSGLSFAVVEGENQIDIEARSK